MARVGNLGGAMAGPAARTEGDIIQRRKPVPEVRGNLPPTSESDDSRGRQVPARQPEWYEKADPRSSTAVPTPVKDWQPAPAPPEGEKPRNILYAKGGLVSHDWRKGKTINCKNC